MPPEVLAPLFGLFGVSIGAIVQWLVARRAVRAENERLLKRLTTEFHLQQFSAWQSQFQTVIADLLAATDPEAEEKVDKRRVIPLVLRAQLMLNPNLPSHARVNDLVNKLVLSANGWHGQVAIQEVLMLHASLLDSARQILYQPGKRREDG